MNNINLNSQAWCNFVFEGKNKNYGAYALRLDSSDRHLKALFVVVALGVAALSLSHVLGKHQQSRHANIDLGNTNTDIKIVDLNQKPDEAVPVIEIPPVPVVKVASSVAFTPPVIVHNDLATDDELMLRQDQLSNTDAVIGAKTFEGNTTDDAPLITDMAPVIVDKAVEKIHVSVEQMPTFPGGDTELMAFLKNNLIYPVIAAEIGVQGKVVLRFVVGSDGAVDNIEILKSLDPSCDKEAVRVVKRMPKWIPGKQNGSAVKVYFTLPVTFRLSN